MPELIVTRKRIAENDTLRRAGECDTCNVIGAGRRPRVQVETRTPSGDLISWHLECAHCYSMALHKLSASTVSREDLDALQLGPAWAR